MSKYLKLLAWLVLAHAVALILFWLTNPFFYTATNDFLATKVGRRLDFITYCMAFAAFVGVWSAARLVLLRGQRTHRLAGLTAWLYGILGVVFIIFFYGSFAVLFQQEPLQLTRLGLLLGYFRLVIDILLLAGVTLLCLYLVKKSPAGRSLGSGKPGAGSLIAILVPFVLMWAAPLVSPPPSVYRGALPSMPRLIAHRGAAMLTPENTLASAQKAIDLGVYGLETDITISKDGTLFLMHDNTLDRTTNVSQVFPTRNKDAAENFTLAELKQLNAGEWFIKKDSFGTIASGLITPAQVEQFRQQTVPTLAEELDLLKKSSQVFIFDLKTPTGSSASTNVFDLCFQQLVKSGLNERIWFLLNASEIEKVRTAAPLMKRASGVDFKNPLAVKELLDKGYQIVNAGYGLPASWIKQYKQAGLWVNLYVIDEEWNYSRLWLLGVDSTTTNNVQGLKAVQNPVLGLSFAAYLALWVVLGLLGAGLIALAFLRRK